MNKLIDSLDHVTIITKDLNETKKFYINILGMEIDDNRPPFDFDGVWLSINKRAIVHIIVKKNHDTDHSFMPTLDHIAFKANNIENIKKKLKENNITYNEKLTPDNKIAQIFIKDPNGIKIELSKII
jgi:catechol 2,3-dioxygenase-like lactoylglutathione lyase family enzyme